MSFKDFKSYINHNFLSCYVWESRLFVNKILIVKYVMLLNYWSHVILRFSFEKFDFLYFLQATGMGCGRIGKTGKSRRNISVGNQEEKYLWTCTWHMLLASHGDVPLKAIWSTNETKHILKLKFQCLYVTRAFFLLPRFVYSLRRSHSVFEPT